MANGAEHEVIINVPMVEVEPDNNSLPALTACAFVKSVAKFQTQSTVV